jgi:putative ABC transport system permease protein
MPKDFAFPLTWGPESHIALWLPMSFLPEELAPEEDANWYLGMVGRLKPGVTAAQAEADADRVAQQVMRSYPPDEANFRIHPVVYPLQQITVLQARPFLRLLFWAVAVILLIACANFAGLLLIRAIRRQRETAVRLALGATAGTVLRQTIVESLVLSGAGGLIGVGLATLAIYGGRNLLPDNLPLTNEITLNWMVAGFALLLVVLTGFFCGLAPGLAALRTNVNVQMKEAGCSGSASGAHARLRSGIVVLEIAVMLLLLVASGLLLRSFQKMSEVKLGFEPDHVATAAYSLPQNQYPAQALIDAFNHGLLERLRQLPGVRNAGLTSTIPAGGGGESLTNFVADGYLDPRGPGKTTANPIMVIGDYLRAMGIPLLEGRYLADADNANSQLVVIVNHEFAEHYWRHQDPIGKRMRLGTAKMSTPWMTVVGEVADAKLWSPDQDAHEQFYMPVAQLEKDLGTLAQSNDLNGNSGYIVVQSPRGSEEIENGIRQVVRELDPQLPLNNVATMNQVVAQSESPRRFNTAVILSFALAVLLAGRGFILAARKTPPFRAGM